ncbi:hypothetical protein WN943_008013 [Citrus x changshan-huyou]
MSSIHVSVNSFTFFFFNLSLTQKEKNSSFYSALTQNVCGSRNQFPSLISRCCFLHMES